MQFNSYIFIFLYLPIVVGGYYLTNRIDKKHGNIFLIIMSAVFYAWAGVQSFAILIGSIISNCIINFFLFRMPQKKIILLLGIVFNILLLFYYKYSNFFIANLNLYANQELDTLEIILPLGISFFTFQQIAYQVDTYRGETQDNSVSEYLLDILFFPKLLMGPLVSSKDIILQLRDDERKRINYPNIVKGIQMFGRGLFKKVMIADTFSRAVTWGFSNISATTSADFFIVMLSYTFQIYFDFSGYCDMATGISSMLNIDLPINFNSPYQAMSIRDFWKRWHISLSKFFTNYVYIPLGGNRKGKIQTYINVLIIFIISGIWHGANWTFILWGILHGAANVLDRVFEKKWEKIHPAVQWFLTFMCVNLLWLLFRANSVSEWFMLLKHMFSFQDMHISDGLINSFILPETNIILSTLHLDYFNDAIRGFSLLIWIVAGFLICLLFENNYKRKYNNSVLAILLTVITMTWGILCLGRESVFVYFNF